MTTTDTLKDRLRAADPALAAELLHSKTSHLVDVMIPRRELSDGTLGFKARVQTTITLKFGGDASADTPEEVITLVAEESEIRLHDPVLTLDGALRLDLETITYEAVGTSEVLWPGERVRLRVGRGLDPMMRPTFGRMEIDPLVNFGTDPVRSVQEVYVEADTPLGTLHNRLPAVMHCDLTSIPPIGQPYVQQGQVALYDADGQVVCMKTTTESELTALVD
ncbi:hypothetical protein Q8791_22390 [Nocardiopsis sp. CT-R113]|jgi:hypothetical protein|uniref:Uncharacterized protein n=1 Tax=Nocardiopsis codii TaxID=3065942 RepID=A0ABU7KCK9_9ACTN|nr:hypothetical protein [Nocardiopsis sp. CT-R113]MEE2039969.1 hypothetical protein [Nocardiopsis sp. CT-R113]